MKLLVLLILISLLGFLLFAVYSYQGGVTFEDENVAAAIRQQVGKSGHMLTRTDLLQIKHLDLSGKKIRSLQGLEQLVLLESLDLTGNRITCVRPLSMLRRLNNLNLSHNRIQDLVESGLSELAGLPLSVLNLSYNDISDLVPLSAFVSLRELNARNNKISDLTALHTLEQMQRLNLRDNQIRCLQPLTAMPDLRYLNLHSNDQLGNITPLGHLPALETLVMRNVPLSAGAFSVIGDLQALRELNLRNTGVEDITFLLSLFKAGALQDDVNAKVFARLDLRDNPIDWSACCNEMDAGLCRYLSRISNRVPYYQPAQCVLSMPVFSHAGGFYSEEFRLVISHPDPEVTIYYTLDGSFPCPDNLDGTVYAYKNHYIEHSGDPPGLLLHGSYRSHVYNSPIPIYNRSFADDRYTQKSSTTCSQPSYFPAAPVKKGMTIQAIAVKEGRIRSRAAGHTYFVFAEGNPYSIPVVSLSIQPDDLFDYDAGTYTAGVDWDLWRTENPELPPSNRRYPANFHRRGRAFEKPLRLEIYSAGQAEPLVNQRAGFRMHGFYSRRLPVKHMRLYARDCYDVADTFSHDLFSVASAGCCGMDNTTYKRLLLRTLSNGGPFIHDWVAHEIMRPVFAGMLRGVPVVQFINGEYWGLASLRDRFDAYHIAYNYNFAVDNIIMTDDRYTMNVGDSADYRMFHDMTRYIRRNSMVVEAHYHQAKSLLDMISFMDNFIITIYVANSHHEYGYWRVREPVDDHVGDGRWRLFVKDFDQIMQPGNWLKRRAERNPMFGSLLENPDFRTLFINRFADHMNTTFAVERVGALVNDQFALFADYLEEDHQRWGRWFSTPRDARRLLDFLYERPSVMREQIREQFDLSGTFVLDLDISDDSHGYITVNTVDIRKGTVGVSDTPYPWSGVYFNDISIQLTAVAEDGFEFVGWHTQDADKPDGRDAVLSRFSSDTTITFVGSDDVSLKAVFE